MTIELIYESDDLQNFKTFTKVNDPEFQQALFLIHEMMALRDVSTLNESLELDEAQLMDKITSGLSKLGFKTHKGKGLIHYLAAAGKAMGSLFWALIRGDKNKIKEITSKEIKRQDVLDFLYKLDLATLHVVTGPLHLLDAITGWEIVPAMGNKLAGVSKKVVQTFKDAFQFIKDKATSVLDQSVMKPFIKKVSDAEQLLRPQYIAV